jgi:hypothetical protein
MSRVFADTHVVRRGRVLRVVPRRYLIAVLWCFQETLEIALEKCAGEALLVTSRESCDTNLKDETQSGGKMVGRYPGASRADRGGASAQCPFG